MTKTDLKLLLALAVSLIPVLIYGCSVHADTPPLKINVVEVEGRVTVVCYVKRAVLNTQLDLGIYDVGGLGVRLNGQKSTPIYLFYREKVPCGTQVAFCDLKRAKDTIRETFEFRANPCVEVK